MKRCPKCGNICDVDSAFCGECGTPLGQPAPAQTPIQAQGMKDHKKSKKVPVLVAIIVVLIVVIAVLAVKMYFLDKPQKQEEEQKQDSEMQTTEADTEEAFKNADFNAVEKVYFDINGKIISVNDTLYIEIDDPVSLYAQNEQKKNVFLANVDKFKLKNGKELNTYVGENAVVSGKISLDEKDRPVLSVESYETADSGNNAEDTAIHTYQIVVTDCTWNEALEQCRQMGGYLVRINSYEEYAVIVNQIQNEGYEKVHFYLGGRRDAFDSNYYWVDKDNHLLDDGTALNSADAWCASAWMTGEPSYVDGDIQEMYMNMFYYKNNLAWVLNDVPDDITGVYSGLTGYICEFEN